MNIEQAKQIPLARVVEYLGGRFSRHGKKGETWWYSPFRPNERRASFVIHEIRNDWHDFARTEKKDAHGDIVDLWTDFHNQSRKDSAAISQALKEIEARFGGPLTPVKRPRKKTARNRRQPSAADKQPRYKLVKTPGYIWIKSLIAEIERRGLSLDIIEPYLKQGFIEDAKTKKRFNAFVFENDNGGWEVSLYNAITGYSFKNCIGHKAPTSFMQGRFNTVLVFESRWDFFTWLEMTYGYTKGYGFIIANGAGMAYAVAGILISHRRVIGKVLIFQHNDPVAENAQDRVPAGEKFTNTIMEELKPYKLTVRTVNDRYKGYKDLNEWWMAPEAKMKGTVIFTGDRSLR